MNDERSSASSEGQWSEDPNQWTQEQRDQYFGVNDHSEAAPNLVAEADVPQVDDGGGTAVA
jgi:hypothetical protein